MDNPTWQLIDAVDKHKGVVFDRNASILSRRLLSSFYTQETRWIFGD